MPRHQRCTHHDGNRGSSVRRSCTDRSHRPVPANATGDHVNDDTTTTGKSAKPAKTAKASADQPTDDTAQPLSDTEPADASQDAVVSEVHRLRNEIKRTNRQHRKLVKRG